MGSRSGSRDTEQVQLKGPGTLHSYYRSTVWSLCEDVCIARNIEMPIVKPETPDVSHGNVKKSQQRVAVSWPSARLAERVLTRVAVARQYGAGWTVGSGRRT